MSTQTEAILWSLGGFLILMVLFSARRRWRPTIEADDLAAKLSFKEWGFNADSTLALPNDIQSTLDPAYGRPWVIAAGHHAIKEYMCEAWLIYPETEQALRKQGFWKNTFRRLTNSFRPTLILKFQLQKKYDQSVVFLRKKELPTFKALNHQIQDQRLKQNFFITARKPEDSRILENPHIISALRGRSWCDVLLSGSHLLVASLPYAYSSTPPADIVDAYGIIDPVSVTPWAEARESIRLVQAFGKKS